MNEKDQAKNDLEAKRMEVVMPVWERCQNFMFCQELNHESKEMHYYQALEKQMLLC
jgi:hypothetical protein